VSTPALVDALPHWLRKRSSVIIIVLVVWVILATLLRGIDTLELSTATNTPVTEWFRELAASIRGSRSEAWIFIFVFNPIRAFIQGFVEVIRSVIAVPGSGDVIPVIGWLGVVALVGFIVYASSNWRTALLSMGLLTACGMLGVWVDTMDTLAMTIGAVLLSLAIALPIGIWAGLNDRFMAFIRPVLDLAQILPTLVYLAPLALVFLVGIAASTIATMIYSIPICVRITAHAIRSLKAGPIEASESMGSTRLQMLRKVQLPMARRTIILGINQTTLAALSFVVIAALIGSPGLGKPVIEALTIRNVGNGVVAGLAVVFLAVMLDRATTAAVQHSGEIPPEGAALIRRRIGLAAAAAATIGAIALSRYQLWAAIFPERLVIGSYIGNAADAATDWITSNFYALTIGLNQNFTIHVLNRVEAVLADAPWYLTIIAISVLAAIIGGRFVGVLSLVLLTSVVLIGLWNDAMVTLTQVLIATAIVMLIGVLLGVAAGRSPRVERALKPFLDAGQTLPAFVYLVPVLALFGPSRFAAIVCGVFYAAPVVVRVVADGVRGVPKDMVEAAVSSGSSTTQVVTKVQLPASKKSLLLGANQGMIFVLAVVVIGGFVGAGGLGYLVIVGQSKPELQGKGLAAGLAIVLLGIVMDRIAQAGARRNEKQPT